ncbi:putative mitochondrial protein [Tanacetum coccineum]|uniref:Mitochondrial protein n=1 Tax=Tanacetum coccineum TaxID=301880 RepID=A0ABQ5EGR9_9ASTR
MNSVFKPFLRKFTLVFFDDILVYSPSVSEHIDHLRRVLQVMREHNLFAKQSKCVFETTQVEYLGHIICAQGVSTHLSKIRAMQEWPVPSTLKQLRGFLGLTGHYKRFIKGYASISQPLTMLLKKDAFQWNSQAQEAFERLKQVMVPSLVLALPNFEEEFVIETDASRMGTVGCGLGFAKVEGRITTPFQSKWLLKLLGYDYEIEYRKGADNAASDALSRIERQGALFSLLAGTSNELMDVVVATWSSDSSLQAIIKGLQDDTLVNSNSVVGGYSGNKSDLSAYPGLLQPLHIAEKVWQDLSIDFIESLPLSQGKSAFFSSAQLFLDHVYKLYGLPKTIVSDKDKIFMSHFWESLFKMLHVKLKLSTAYHPQTDGQTEVVNKYMETYLRCMTGEAPKEWVKWIPLVEYCGSCDKTLQAREQVVQLLKFNLKKSQDRMKSQADKRVLEKVGKVTYKLKLPDNAKVHPVFHVSQLKPCYSDSVCNTPKMGRSGKWVWGMLLHRSTARDKRTLY